MHAAEIEDLETLARMLTQVMPMIVDPKTKADTELYILAANASIELIQCHDATGIDLHCTDHWLPLVEHMLGRPLDEET